MLHTFEMIWYTVSEYFFLIIAIPCMSMFHFRYNKKYRFPLILFATLTACLSKFGIRTVFICIFQNTIWWPSYFLDQCMYIFIILLFCLILYKGNFYSIVLTVLLAMSIASQCGCIVGGIMDIFRDTYTIGMLVIRDMLGYSSYAFFYLFFKKYLNISSFYLTNRDHFILLTVALTNFFLTCCFSQMFPPGKANSIPFYLACLFTTLSIIFLIFRFTKDHQKVQEQQLVIQEMKLSENTISQIKETSAQMRELKHEISNYFIYAEQLLENKEYDMLKKYLVKIKAVNITATDIITTDSSVVNSIINQKYAYAKSLNIKTNFKIILPNPLPLDDLTICSLFGNLLNNAIEACQKQDSAFIYMDVHPVKNYLAIRIDNSVTSDILKYNPNLTSTKDDTLSHGNGIKILKRIVEQHDGMLHYEMSSPNCFTMQILLKLTN